jgi:hypothetical protein
MLVLSIAERPLERQAREPGALSYDGITGCPSFGHRGIDNHRKRVKSRDQVEIDAADSYANGLDIGPIFGIMGGLARR